MSHSSNLRICLTFLLAVLAVAAPRTAAAPATAAAAAARPSPVLLVAHPSDWQLSDLLFLRRAGLLPTRDLRFLAVYHIHDRPRRQKLIDHYALQPEQGVSFAFLHCSLTEEEVYRRNGCTEELTRLFEEVDGMLFPGGKDLPPSLYGQEQRPETELMASPIQPLWETSFLFHLVVGDPAAGLPPLLDRRPAFPIVCICLGLQMLNVAAGGTLHQDIEAVLYGAATAAQPRARPDVARHQPQGGQRAAGKKPRGVAHRVRIEADAPLAFRLGLKPGELPLVWSNHHQAIDRLGSGLRVEATSLDGRVVEMVSHLRYPNVMGVQFHPEKKSIFQQAHGARMARALRGEPVTLRLHQQLWRQIDRALRRAEPSTGG